MSRSFCPLVILFSGHFFPGHYVPVTMSPGHFVLYSYFVPVHYVPVILSPGHFVFWLFWSRSLCPGRFVPWSFCRQLLFSRPLLSPFFFVSGHFVPGNFVPWSPLSNIHFVLQLLCTRSFCPQFICPLPCRFPDSLGGCNLIILALYWNLVLAGPYDMHWS
jgi:hypothetical protein